MQWTSKAQKVSFAKVQDQNNADHIIDKQLVTDKEFLPEWQRVNSAFYVEVEFIVKKRSVGNYLVFCLKIQEIMCRREEENGRDKEIIFLTVLSVTLDYI
jgi:hypothetical protein